MANPEENPQSESGSVFTNSKVIFIIGLVLIIFIIFILMNAVMQPERKQQQENQTLKKVSSATNDASKIIGDRVAGLTTAQKPVIPSNAGISGEESKPEESVKEEKKEEPKQERFKPLEPKKFNLEAPPKVDDVDRQMEQMESNQIRQIKIENFKQAVSSRTKTDFKPLEAHANVSSGRDSISSERERLQQLRNGGADDMFNQRMAQLQMRSGAMASMSENAITSAATGNNRTVTEFESRTPDPSHWILQSQVLRPAKYSILTGTVIPATLVTGINSDLPGQVTAQVSQNVYDTARGKYLLIPQGARLIGAYSSNVLYGQERLLLSWRRIIFPDGRSLDIGSMPATDQAGYSGMNDEVNNHYVRLFGSSLMLSVISAGAAWASDRTSNNYDSKSFSNEFASSAGSQLSQTSSELIRKNMNIAPTLTIRPGYRLNVMVTKDISVTGVYHDYQY